jgi:exodeoxyribonuclease VII small subunit
MIMASATSPESFDAAFEELRNIVQTLQSPEVSVDSLTEYIRRSSVLLAYCSEHLKGTEKEVKDLLDQLGISEEEKE